MNSIPRTLFLAMLVAASPLAGAADKPAKQETQTHAAENAKATEGPVFDWIVYDEATYTPVLDEVSQSLAAARRAFDAKDYAIAAAQMRAVAAELQLQADRAGDRYKELEKIDKDLLAADKKAARDTMKRMNDVVARTNAAADAIQSGKIKTKADLDKAIDKAAQADMERRWLVADVTTWYPVSEQPQRHFTDAAADYAAKNYRAAASDIRKAVSYLRLEAARATGDARRGLDESIVQLDKLATDVAKGTLGQEQAMNKAFARASHALALQHRAKAAESWVRKQYDKAGYELKAAAHSLESAATWVGDQASAGASATVAGTHKLGDKLAAGARWTRKEVSQSFESLANDINALGKKIGGTRTAAKFNPEGGA